MSIVRKIMKVPHELPHGTARSGFLGTLIDKGERYGAAFGFGAAKGYYGERFIWRGHGADLWLGGAALGGALLLDMFGGAKAAKLATHLERIGDAGLMSAIGSLGAHFGLEKAGHQVAVLPSGAKKPAQIHGIGAVPGAKAGPFLSPQEIANWGARRAG